MHGSARGLRPCNRSCADFGTVPKMYLRSCANKQSENALIESFNRQTADARAQRAHTSKLNTKLRKRVRRDGGGNKNIYELSRFSVPPFPVRMTAVAEMCATIFRHSVNISRRHHIICRRDYFVISYSQIALRPPQRINSKRSNRGRPPEKSEEQTAPNSSNNTAPQRADSADTVGGSSHYSCAYENS